MQVFFRETLRCKGEETVFHQGVGYKTSSTPWSMESLALSTPIRVVLTTFSARLQILLTAPSLRLKLLLTEGRFRIENTVVKRLLLGLLASILFVGFSQLVLAHDTHGNKAKLTARHGSLELFLNIHSNKWTDSYEPTKLDDEILKKTVVKLNQKSIELELKKIEKKAGHYEILYLFPTAIPLQVSTAYMALPSELGRFAFTFIKAYTKTSGRKSEASFSFR